MQAPTQGSAHGTTASATGSWRILVVDDDAAIRTVAARILSKDGFEVREAPDGVEAIQLLERSAESVHLVLSDIVMPRLNGVELLQHLSVSYPELPVILMSAYHPAELGARGITAPCSTLQKPFGREALLAEVRRCLPAAR